MRVEKDFVELLELLNKNKVKYCVVGAFAVAFHSRPRYTKDMDILVEPSIPNAKRILQALHQFGFGVLKLSEEDFVREKNVIQLGYEPVRVDLLTSLKGTSFEEIWKTRKVGRYGEIPVNFIGLDQLLKNKRRANRPIDRADLEVLLPVQSKKSKK